MNLILRTLILILIAVVRIRGNLPIIEGRRPLDCSDVDECEEQPGQEVCGTDGRTYKTLCGFMRAHCKDGSVGFKSYGECSASEKCWGIRQAALADAKSISGLFIPGCNPDGTFKPVQCHKDTGYCWCSTPLGHAIIGTATRVRNPDCQNMTKPIVHKNSATQRPPPGVKGGCQGSRRKSFNKNMLKSIIQEYRRENKNLVDAFTEYSLQLVALRWKFEELDKRPKDGRLRRAEYKGIRKIIRRNFKPRKCAKKFPKFCDLNTDKKISLEEWNKCFILQESEDDAPPPGRAPHGKGGDGSRNRGQFVKWRPCDYERKQAIESGNPDIYTPKCDHLGKFRPVQCYGSNATNLWYCFCVDVETGDMIEKTSTKDGTPNCSVSWPKCPPPDKEEIFLKALRNHYVKYAQEKIYKKDLKGVTVNEDNVIEQIFKLLDKNNNNFIDRREKKVLRKTISKKNKNLWVCGRKIHIVCDSDSDKKISLQEFFTCLTPRKVASPNDIPRPRDGKNPFEETLTSSDDGVMPKRQHRPQFRRSL